jgi:hypothetical protein
VSVSVHAIGSTITFCAALASMFDLSCNNVCGLGSNATDAACVAHQDAGLERVVADMRSDVEKDRTLGQPARNRAPDLRLPLPGTVHQDRSRDGIFWIQRERDPGLDFNPHGPQQSYAHERRVQPTEQSFRRDDGKLTRPQTFGAYVRSDREHTAPFHPVEGPQRGRPAARGPKTGRETPRQSGHGRKLHLVLRLRGAATVALSRMSWLRSPTHAQKPGQIVQLD